MSSNVTCRRPASSGGTLTCKHGSLSLVSGIALALRRSHAARLCTAGTEQLIHYTKRICFKKLPWHEVESCRKYLAVRRWRKQAHVGEHGGGDVPLDAALEAVTLGGLLLAEPAHLLRQAARPFRVQLRERFPVACPAN